MSTVAQFISLLNSKASPARYRREDGGMVCPCVTPQGFRDPEYHAANPTAVVCNERGRIYGGDDIVWDEQAWSLWLPGDLRISEIQWELLIAQEVASAQILNDGTQDFIQITLANDPRPAAIAAGIPLPSYPGLVWPAENPKRNYNPRDFMVKAFVQPIQSTRATRLSAEQLLQMFGEIQADDHLGIFPFTWNGKNLDFRDWSQSGEDFIEYAGQRFTVVNANLIPDPSDGNPYHHWEVGLRLISNG